MNQFASNILIAVAKNPGRLVKSKKTDLVKVTNQLIKEQKAEIKKFERQIKDWQSRKYKKSGKTVKVGTNEERGDTPWQPGVRKVSVDKANEKRRQRTIEQFEDEIKEIKEGIARLATLTHVFESNSFKKIDGLLKTSDYAFKLLYKHFGGEVKDDILLSIKDPKMFKAFIVGLKHNLKNKREEDVKDFDPLKLLRGISL